MELLSKINEKLYVMPTYGIALSAKGESGQAFEEEVSRISESIIQSEKPRIRTKKDIHPPVSHIKRFDTSIILFLTNDCNMRCEYCFYSSGGIKNESLSCDDINEILMKLFKNAAILRAGGKNAEVHIFLSGGGEPTLAWNQIIHLVDTLKKLKASTQIDYTLDISTNGLLTHEKADFLAQNFSTIQVSFDCIEDIQNTQRPLFNGTSSYEHVEETLQYFDKQGTPYHIHTVVMPDYYHRLFEMVKRLYTRHPAAAFLQIEMCTQAGRGANYKEKAI